MHKSVNRPAYQIYGKTRREAMWRIISVVAVARRNMDSGWPRPFFAGTVITWTDSIIACGWDFAATILREQMKEPASRCIPVTVRAGRLADKNRRIAAGFPAYPSASEILAHECGHTAQARRLSWLYLPKGAVFTLWREGNGWLHQFENEASEQGQFGGIVIGSVDAHLLHRLESRADD